MDSSKTKPGTKKCPKCQEEISSKAKKCPKCQADLRSWPARHPILSILLILIMFSIIYAILFGESKEDKITKVVNAPVAEKTTVDELIDTKRNNSVVFEAKYLHKKVEVSGYFGRIAGSGDRKYVELLGSEGKLTVGKPDCYPIIMDDFVHLKNGEPITVTGIIENGALASEIRYCELIKDTDARLGNDNKTEQDISNTPVPAQAPSSTPSPIQKIDFTITAKQFSKEFKESDYLFGQKYEGKTIKLTGTFIKIRENVITKKPIVQLEGIDIVSNIDCLPQNVDEFIHLKNGESITVIGLGHKNVLTPEIIKCELIKDTDARLGNDNKTETADNTDKSAAAAPANPNHRERQPIVPVFNAEECKFYKDARLSPDAQIAPKNLSRFLKSFNPSFYEYAIQRFIDSPITVTRTAKTCTMPSDGECHLYEQFFLDSDCSIEISEKNAFITVSDAQKYQLNEGDVFPTCLLDSKKSNKSGTECRGKFKSNSYWQVLEDTPRTIYRWEQDTSSADCSEVSDKVIFVYDQEGIETRRALYKEIELGMQNLNLLCK